MSLECRDAQDEIREIRRMRSIRSNFAQPEKEFLLYERVRKAVDFE